jgi:glycosyltransferase involved in cell wall biosynthesis
LFAARDFDAVYLHQGGYPGSYTEHIAGMAAKHADRKIRVITSIQNTPMKYKNHFCMRQMDRLVNRYADKIIFASRDTHQIYKEETRLDQSKMNIIAEGVAANVQGKMIEPNDSVVHIGMIAAYERRKGHRILFDALALLKKDGIRNFKLHCYGQSNYGDYDLIVQYARQLGIESFIEWHEFERDFDKLYGQKDIIVQTSIQQESMPLVPIEAAAYYKPVAASRFQGTKEVVVHEKTGYLFDVGDSAQLARYLSILIKDREKRKLMGLAARERYLQYFHAGIMTARYAAVFHSQESLHMAEVT